MRGFLLALAVVVVLGVCAVGVVAPKMQQRLLQAPDASAGSEFVLVEVRKGAGAASIAEELAKKTLIRNARAFLRMLRHNGWEGKLKPGLYKIAPGKHAEEIARQIVDHNTWKIKVTIPEGLTLRQIAERIEAAGKAEGGQWLPKSGEVKAVASAAYLKKVTGIEIPTKYAEGYLFPDTYFFPAGASSYEIVARMFEELARRFAARHRNEIRQSKLSLHELVTLASIVEREAEVDRERPLIAQVFINRLDIGMKLESCATVQYALPRHKSRLLFADLKVQSPYNTYIHKGLPPGPICSPGEASLLAVLRPQETDALYFVSRGDGTHRFSRTFGEHESAIKEIRGRLTAG